MDSSEREKLDAIISQVLDAVAREAGKDREWLTLEVEQVVTRGVFEAHRLGARTRSGRRRSNVGLPALKKPED